MYNFLKTVIAIIWFVLIMMIWIAILSISDESDPAAFLFRQGQKCQMEHGGNLQILVKKEQSKIDSDTVIIEPGDHYSIRCESRDAFKIIK